MSAFAQDILQGLTNDPKYLPSKYFYDERGDALFQQIMAMPEYYLTNAEAANFESYHQDWIQQWKGTPFYLVELGAGDGTKTKTLLKALIEAQMPVTYSPIDISENALQQLLSALQHELPELNTLGQCGEYFKALAKLETQMGQARKVFLFLGSNLGNFNKEMTRVFLKNLHQFGRHGDQLLLGIDLKKDPAIILNAYNDETGITAAFNLNLLARINRELDADFDLDAFKHWESYHPISGATESFLVSKKAQKIHLNALNQTISFEAWEAIKVELSQKYSLKEVESLLTEAGFSWVQHYLDEQSYFVNTLWKW